MIIIMMTMAIINVVLICSSGDVGITSAIGREAIGVVSVTTSAGIASLASIIFPWATTNVFGKLFASI